MINENNIKKYGLEWYKEVYAVIQEYRGQELMIIKVVRERTRMTLADAKIIIEDVKKNEAAYKQYLFNVDIVGTTDSII